MINNVRRRYFIGVAAHVLVAWPAPSHACMDASFLTDLQHLYGVRTSNNTMQQHHTMHATREAVNRSGKHGVPCRLTDPVFAAG